MAYTSCGAQNVLASTAVAIGVSGKPTIVYGFSFKSGGTAGVVIFTDGTQAGGTERARITGTINLGTVVSFGPYGKFFPSGCWLTVDANTTYVDVNYITAN